MKTSSIIAPAIAAAAIIYGYWGAFTNAGNKVYDEMDAMFPFFILFFGVILLITFLIILLFRRRRNKN